MNNYHSLAYAIYADRIDPLLVMAHTRKVKSGSDAVNRLRAEAYRSARDRSRSRAYLPDRQPRDFWDAGLLVLEKAQVMGAQS